ncbi:MAG: hypothetical protein D6160_19255 [Ketobacter sp.]|nr:MAG: hypothetical protein D6160_19255 [Ketobacter sp.]
MVPAPLLATIEREQPASTLLVYVHTRPDFTPPAAVQPITTDELLDSGYTDRADLIFIGQDCLQDEKEKLMQLVAKCRDILSSRVLVEMGGNAALNEQDMLALAFTHYAVTETESGETQYYYFDLKTYKPVPDWLNPKFWANPQNWDKFRW